MIDLLTFLAKIFIPAIILFAFYHSFKQWRADRRMAKMQSFYRRTVQTKAPNHNVSYTYEYLKLDIPTEEPELVILNNISGRKQVPTKQLKIIGEGSSSDYKET